LKIVPKIIGSKRTYHATTTKTNFWDLEKKLAVKKLFSRDADRKFTTTPKKLGLSPDAGLATLYISVRSDIGYLQWKKK